MKKNVLRKINVVIWIVIVAVAMFACYKVWSSNGTYNCFSFLVSFIMYGSVGFVLGSIIDEKIKNWKK